VNVVIDTNVLISGVLWFGPAHKALQVALSRYKLAQSPQTLQEFSDVIHRAKFKTVLSARGVLPDTLTEYLAKESDLYLISSETQRESHSIPIDDPEDRLFVDLVLETGARWLLSGDRHLLDLKMIGRTEVVRVADFLKAHSPASPS
jgi:putative PIN family toxin of toxin-antitoxin system